MTNALLRGKDLMGQPVVDLSTGDDIAEIRDVIFDPTSGTISGFTLSRRGFFTRRTKQLLPVAEVHSVGTDAVMVVDASALTLPEDAPAEVAEAKREGDVMDDMVITVSGRQLGAVRDVIVVGGAHPRVVGFEIAGGSVGDGLIPIGVHNGVSGSALIVPDQYEARVRTDLTGLAAELADIEGSRS
jgi:uncharacterized protein YrrD